jgi:hypothetical protein
MWLLDRGTIAGGLGNSGARRPGGKGDYGSSAVYPVAASIRLQDRGRAAAVPFSTGTVPGLSNRKKHATLVAAGN